MSLSRSLCALLVLTFASACGGGGGGGDGNPDLGIAPAPPGIRGLGALSFDGVDDVAGIGQVPPLHYLMANGFTLEAWIRPETMPQQLEPFRPLFGADNAQALYIWNGSLFLLSYAPNATQVVTPPNLKVNEWQHVAATFDGQAYRLYINGVQVELKAHSGGALSLPNLHIGDLPSAITSYHGDIDEIRIWTIARTPEEIQAYMNTPVEPDTFGLRSYFRCEGESQELVDSTKHELHGALGADVLAPDALDPARTSPDF